MGKTQHRSGSNPGFAMLPLSPGLTEMGHATTGLAPRGPHWSRTEPWARLAGSSRRDANRVAASSGRRPDAETPGVSCTPTNCSTQGPERCSVI